MMRWWIPHGQGCPANETLLLKVVVPHGLVLPSFSELTGNARFAVEVAVCGQPA